MGDDESDIRVASDRPGDEEIDYRAGSVKQELAHWAGILRERGCGGWTVAQARRGRVDEDFCLASIQLFEDRIESLVSEIQAVEIGMQGDPVRVQVV